MPWGAAGSVETMKTDPHEIDGVRAHVNGRYDVLQPGYTMSLFRVIQRMWQVTEPSGVRFPQDVLFLCKIVVVFLLFFPPPSR